MRTYFIYWMKEEVINSYFGKEALIMQLLNEIHDHNEHDLVKKQIQYITKCLPISTLQNFLKSTILMNRYISFNPESYTIELDEESYATLEFTHECLVLYATGNSEIEILWFEQLRRFAPTFFAFEIQGKVCGWLSPVKQVKKYV